MGLITADDGVWAAVVAAQVMVNFADCWSPMTEEISSVMGNGTGGPFALGEGADKWYGAASGLQEAQQSLTELTEGLPRDYWYGEDRDHFDTEIRNLAAELGDSHNYALAVAITLTALTVPIGAWPILCDGIGVIEAANATAFYVAAASVVGDLGPSEALFAEGEAVTATCLAVINTSMAILISLMAAATEAIVVSDALDIEAQTSHGDKGIAAEFGKAVVDSAGEVAVSVALDRISHSGEGKGEGGEGEGSGSGEGEGSVPGQARAKVPDPVTVKDPAPAKGPDPVTVKDPAPATAKATATAPRTRSRKACRTAARKRAARRSANRRARVCPG